MMTMLVVAWMASAAPTDVELAPGAGAAGDAGLESLDLGPRDPVARDVVQALVTLGTSCSCASGTVFGFMVGATGILLAATLLVTSISYVLPAAIIGVGMGCGGCCVSGAMVGAWVTVGSGLHAVGLWNWSLANEVGRWTLNLILALL